MITAKSLLCAISVSLILFLAACGEGTNTSSSSQNSGNATNKPQALKPGTTTTLAANTTVLVPAGTTISTPNGNTITVSGSNNVISVPTGSVVTVPQSATGAANNTVTTGTSAAKAATVTVLAGSSNAGNPVDGTGSAAVFWGAGGTYLKLDSAGNIIMSDRGYLRKVTQAGVVTTYTNPNLIVGSSGVAIDSGGNFFAVGNSIQPVMWSAFLQELSATGAVNILSNEFETGNVFVGFGGLAVDSGDNLYFADQANNRIMKLTSEGVATVFAGTGAAGMNDGNASTSTFNSPNDVAFDGNNNLLVMDSGNKAIRKITPVGTVSTFVSGLVGGEEYLAVDNSGNCYAAGMGPLYRISPNGVVTQITLSSEASFSGLAVDGLGNLYTKFWGNAAEVVKITPQ
jgi:hypothetical protein